MRKVNCKEKESGQILKNEIYTVYFPPSRRLAFLNTPLACEDKHNLTVWQQSDAKHD